MQQRSNVAAHRTAFSFVLILISLPRLHASDLPPQLHVPTGFVLAQSHFVQYDTATFEYPAAGKTERIAVEGHRWDLWLHSDAHPVVGPDPTAATIAAALTKDGWTILRGQGLVIARKGETWLNAYGNSGSVKIVIVEKSPMPRPITLAAPSATVENATDDADLPWFTPFPGGKLKSIVHADRPINITEPNAKETSFSGPTTTRQYEIPKDVSPYELVNAYRRALEPAGWKIVRSSIGGDGVVLAHYAKNGRDLWLYVHDLGTGQTVSVSDMGADAAADNLKKALTSAGHVAVYGIYFDTDSSTPRPESSATLQHILELLQGNPSLRLEVQGHTDVTGNADHNQKLSDQRAASVRSWLTAHAIAANRLTSHGYGATKPIADNKTPEGKAKNRRVELAKL